MKIHKTCYYVYEDGHEEVFSEFIYTSDAWDIDDRLRREFEVHHATKVTVERSNIFLSGSVVGNKVVYEKADDSEECRTIVKPQLTMTIRHAIDPNSN